MKKDWEIKKLGDLVTQINGLWKGKKEPFINVAVIRNTNFSKDCKLKLDDVEYLDVELKQYSSRKLQGGDIIIEKSGGSDKQPVGRPILFNIEDGEYSFSNFTSTLRIKDLLQVSAEYLQQYLYFRWLNGDTRNLQSHTTGIHNLDFKAYLNFDIILPPLEEQKRIVKILDEKFAQLETIKTNAQTNLENAKDLFQAKLTSIYNSNYSLVKVCEIATIKGGKRIPKGRKLVTENTGHPYIRVTDFTDNGSVSLDDIRYITEDIYQIIKRYTITVDDVFISIAGTIGKVGIVPAELNNANLTENACKLILKENVFNKYIVYIFLSDEVKKITQESARANAMPKLSILRLSEIEIPLPPLPEQKRIVKELDTLSEKVRQLQEIYTKQIANCDELKQAYLQKAFEGDF